MRNRWIAGTAAAALAGLMATAGAVAQNAPKAQAKACTSEAGGAGNVLAKAQAFAATLSAEQKAKVQLAYDKANAGRWTNLPWRMLPRSGVRFGEMDAAQQAAARRLIGAAMSSCGAEMFDGIRAADGVLIKINANNSWDPGNYAVAFVGEPSAARPWLLQVTGHHLAFNLAFNSPMPSATPLFDGVEPVSFNYQGRDYEPLSEQGKAMRALATTIAARPESKLEGTFRDITRGPTAAGDVNFPMTFPTGTSGRGVSYRALSAEQKALVREAMRQWVDLPNGAVSGGLLRAYTSDAALNETYVGISGPTNLETAGGYVRIDGPRVWIELIVQAAVTDPTKVHYHTIWRDKQADYGGAFKG
jgi:hypothetical protein